MEQRLKARAQGRNSAGVSQKNSDGAEDDKALGTHPKIYMGSNFTGQRPDGLDKFLHLLYLMETRAEGYICQALLFLASAGAL